MRTRISEVTGIAFAALMLWAGPAAAAPFTVDDLNDVADASINGSCDAFGVDTCTLRAAIDEANATGAPDTITVSVPGTINLILGTLTINDSATLNGNAGVTTVDANDASRVLTTGGSSVTLNDLRLQDGLTTDNDGAGIFSTATLLTLNRVTVTSNTVNSASGGAGGAGIRTLNTSHSLVLNDSTVSDNTVTGVGGLGGAINGFGPVTLNRSTVSGNSSTLDAGGRGGGIDMAPASALALTISNSTISDNHSGGNNVGAGGGGGVFANGNVTTSIVGSTIAGNTTLGLAGGIRQTGIPLALSENTIYAANTAANGFPNCNLVGATTAESNIDSGTSCDFGTSNGNQENVAVGPLGLGPLASNGDGPQTRAIDADSVALDAGSADCGGLTQDQRGILRPQGPDCDIGAFEFQYRNLTVSTAGAGSGSVAGTGIACPGDCVGAAPEGTELTLTPTAGANSSFSGWSGACTGTGACVVTLDADKAVTATFAALPVTEPVTPLPDPTPTPPKKCKKGQKLKKGKCVKKKKRKKH